MKKTTALALALIVLTVAGCQNKDIASAPESPSRVESEIQNITPQASDSTNAQEDESGAGEIVADSLSPQIIEYAERHAKVLTEHLISRVFHEGIIGRGEWDGDREIFDFFTTLPMYMDNQDHPYYDAVTMTPEYLYIFPKEIVQQIPYELFGTEGWSFGDSMEYNSTAEQYESGLEFGTGRNSYICSDLQTVYLEDLRVIEVTLQLEGSAVVDGDPGLEDLGEHIVRYHVMQETGPFLRYESIRKAK